MAGRLVRDLSFKKALYQVKAKKKKKNIVLFLAHVKEQKRDKN